MASTATTLEFERPIAELEKQIDELKKMAGDQQLQVTEEIAPLEKKLTELRAEIYKNLTPLQRVQVARSNKRPFTADYLRLAFTDFIECHGDRAFRDDAPPRRLPQGAPPHETGREVPRASPHLH
jgi:acetyl-CoA carboxylase carboxyl transferase subunit alpha